MSIPKGNEDESCHGRSSAQRQKAPRGGKSDVSGWGCLLGRPQVAVSIPNLAMLAFKG